jgi:hypothetical protein
MRVIAQDTEMQDENFKADISSNLTQDKRKEIHSIIAYTCDFGHISSRALKSKKHHNMEKGADCSAPFLFS